MLFRRREPETLPMKLRTWLWPRRSFNRSLRYLTKRVLRLNASPHAIAAGFAAGVFSSFTPFVGFHFLIAFAISYLIAGNMASAALGTATGNPATFPLIWAATYETGQFLLYSEQIDGAAPPGLASALMHMDFWAVWTPIVEPMLVGGLPIGLLAGLLAYGIVFAAARSFQKRRARRLVERSRRVQAGVGRGRSAPSGVTAP